MTLILKQREMNTQSNMIRHPLTSPMTAHQFADMIDERQMMVPQGGTTFAFLSDLFVYFACLFCGKVEFWDALKTFVLRRAPKRRSHVTLKAERMLSVSVLEFYGVLPALAVSLETVLR